MGSNLKKATLRLTLSNGESMAFDVLIDPKTLARTSSGRGDSIGFQVIVESKEGGKHLTEVLTSVREAESHDVSCCFLWGKSDLHFKLSDASEVETFFASSGERIQMTAEITGVLLD